MCAWSSSPSFSQDPLQRLSFVLQEQGLAGFLVPRTDEFLNEFISPYAQRLAWLTGFSGSAGLAVVMRQKTFLFVDGRYTLQAAQEVNRDLVEVRSWTWSHVEAVLQENLGEGDVLGYDPWLHSFQDQERYQKRAQQKGFSLKALEANPIDGLWEDQPLRPQAPVQVHPLEYSGKSSEEKRHAICAAQPHIHLWILTAPTSLAWLLNIRGHDVPYTPVAQAYGLLHHNGNVDLFIDLLKVSAETRAFLGQTVHLFPLRDFLPHLQEKSLGKKVSLDPAQTPAALAPFLSKASCVFQPDPCLLPKALKNKAELRGIKKAHLADGIAMVRFLHWLKTIPLDGSESELSITQKLEGFRQKDPDYRGPSFDTIAGHGPNGAIIHYRATPQSNRPLTRETLFLLDSGGQYACGGTTDITRTIALGPPTVQQKAHYTRVLKGHIALARTIFPPGTSGHQLDAIARLPLWSVGLDFEHGTGHGVGSYLAVHEGPQSISPKGQPVALQPGMVLSNEPGYYQAGHYGIRLENLMVVIEKPGLSPFLGFEPLTLVPFEPQLIDETLLSQEEKVWLEAYHQHVCTALLCYLEEPVQQWFKKEWGDKVFIK